MLSSRMETVHGPVNSLQSRFYTNLVGQRQWELFSFEFSGNFVLLSLKKPRHKHTHRLFYVSYCIYRARHITCLAYKASPNGYTETTPEIVCWNLGISFVVVAILAWHKLLSYLHASFTCCCIKMATPEISILG